MCRKVLSTVTLLMIYFIVFLNLNVWKCYVTASDSSDGINSKHCNRELRGRCTLLPTRSCWLWYRHVCHIPYSLIHWSVSYLSVCHIPYYQPEVVGFDIDVSVTSLTHSYTGQSVSYFSLCLSHLLMYHRSETVVHTASQWRHTRCGLVRSRRTLCCSEWQVDVTAAILKVWRHTGNPTLSVDAYCLEEQSRKLSPWYDLKRRSLRLFWRRSPPTTTTRCVQAVAHKMTNNFRGCFILRHPV